MDNNLKASLDGLIAGLAYVPPSNGVACSWVFSNIHPKDFNEVFLLIKSKFLTINNFKHLMNLSLLISQLGTNENFNKIIKQHTFHILSHLINHSTNSENLKLIFSLGKTWVNSALLNEHHFDSLMDSSKAKNFEENLTAGQIASIANKSKCLTNWTPYTPIEFHEMNICNTSQFGPQIDQLMNEISKLTSSS